LPAFSVFWASALKFPAFSTLKQVQTSSEGRVWQSSVVVAVV
jgi:hypothetical protein